MRVPGRGKDGLFSLLKVLAPVVWLTALLHAASASAAPPDAPTIGPTSAGSRQVTVNFTAPASDGGSPILDYTVTSTPGGFAATDVSSPITVTGLTNGTVYTFAVTARNLDGVSAPSAPSNNTTPRIFAPTSGTINNLVVFIRFAGQPEFTQPQSYYDSIFNAPPSSLKSFYLENSYNSLTVNSTFYPSSAGPAVISYQDSHPTAYYAPYNAGTNMIGYQSNAEKSLRDAALVTGALNAVSAQIPDGLNLDWDNDGFIDHVTFEVYSTNAEPIPVMFSSRATYDTAGIMLKGKKLGSYTWITAPQDSSYTAGTFASVEIHEMGHNLGLPDLRNNFNGFNPVGNWDFMANAFSPVHSGAYMKNKVTGWIATIPEITPGAATDGYGHYTINDITNAANNSYKIKLPNTREFLVLEYRPATGAFESHLPGKGLCITRVNEAAGIWGNMNGPPFFLYYFRPGGTFASDGSAANLFTCLDAAAGQVQFNDYSNPACFLSDGTPCGISIDNIGTATGSSISFDVADPALTTFKHAIRGSVNYGNTTNRVIGATVTLSGDASDVATTALGGGQIAYQFLVNRNGTYTVTPSMTNLTFTPASVTVSNVTSDQTLNFAATKITKTISGTVTSAGTPLSGIPVRINCPAGGNYVASVNTDLTGAYSLTVDAGSSCDVWAQLTNYSFTPANKSFTDITSNQVQNFSTNPADVTLGGTITYNGSGLSGVSVGCPGAGSATPVTTGGAGTFLFTVTKGNGSVYTVTPSSSLYKFTPASISTSGVTGSQANMNFTAALKTVSDTALGSSLNPSISGQSVTLTATVTGAAPTGAVTFNDGGAALCSAVPLSGGQAQCATSALAVGSHSIVAVYSGDGSNTGSSSTTLTQIVKMLPPTVDITGPIPTGTVGVNYGFFINTTNTVSLAVTQGTLPPGLSINVLNTDPATGIIGQFGAEIGGIPTAAGTYSGIIVTASNSDWTVPMSQPFSITVKLPTPTIDGLPATTGMVGIPFETYTPTPCEPMFPYNSTCNATSFSISGTLPPGLDFNTASGEISGTPTTVGTYAGLVITASNADGSAQLPAFTIKIAPRVDSFTSVHAMATARQNHTATTLPSGRILVTGGQDSGQAPLASAEIYDPATDSWSPAASMNLGRASHTATLLNNGLVLVAGGYAWGTGTLDSAELYDPASDSWTYTQNSMTVPHMWHTATLLSDGRVLVAGGLDPDVGGVMEAELYDPALNRWSAAASMLESRIGYTATLLANNKVLVAGGGYAVSAELYDPQSDSWSGTTTPMIHNRSYHTATALLNGRILIAGGVESSGDSATAELYDPVADSWSQTGSLTAPRQSHTATPLPDGTALVIGGTWKNSSISNAIHAFAEMYDPATEAWSVAGHLAFPRLYHASALLQNGNVLVTGGWGGAASLASTELYHYVYAIRTSAGSGGSVSANQTVVRNTDSAPVTVTPDSGYYIDAVLIDGASQVISDPGTYNHTFVSVASDHTLDATFSPALAQSIGTISFTPGSLTAGGTTAVSATATSALAVTFTSLTPLVCSVSGATVTGLATGTCTIAAHQSGNAKYSAAPQVTQDISIAPDTLPVVDSFIPHTPSSSRTVTFTLTASDNQSVAQWCVVQGTTSSSCASLSLWKTYPPVLPATFTFPPGTIDGPYTLTAFAKDARGNISLPVSRTITIDTIPPALTVSTPNVTTRRGSIYLSGVCEPNSTITAIVANIQPQSVPCLSSKWGMTVTGLHQGINLVQVSGVDPAGNSTTRVVRVNRQ